MNVTVEIRQSANGKWRGVIRSDEENLYTRPRDSRCWPTKEVTTRACRSADKAMLVTAELVAENTQIGLLGVLRAKFEKATTFSIKVHA